ncbi:MAG: type I methionyl aminopeptidase [Nitrospirae bacterium]|nr:type I methionyl aminopeptidase [Nitrospirota bacterium]MBI3594610.1 type I methionyl aminopeptidase [Nitrospirota bacterium]
MIILKSDEEVSKIKIACQIVAETLAVLKASVKPGVTTDELDRIAEAKIIEKGGKPAFKGYRNFPATLCASVNSEVVHGIPSKKNVLSEGDIIGLDLGAIYDGFYGDAAITVGVGRIEKEAEKLIKITEESLYKGIEQAKIGNRLSDISHAVQCHVESSGYTVVRDFVGHGIGRNLHEEPQIPNYGDPGQGPRLKKGMVLALEPMVNAGQSAVNILSDKWTVVTKDGSLSAHFEHTIAITEQGPVILTSARKAD